jgi:hypothetical protein
MESTEEIKFCHEFSNTYTYNLEDENRFSILNFLPFKTLQFQ